MHACNDIVECWDETQILVKVLATFSVSIYSCRFHLGCCARNSNLINALQSIYSSKTNNLAEPLIHKFSSHSTFKASTTLSLKCNSHKNDL